MKNKIRLTHKTHKGKNKLHEAGTRIWFVINMTEHCQALKNRPALLAIPETMNENQSRWILWTDDFDFEWKAIL